MVDQGVHLRVIQEIMGHSDVRLTAHIAATGRARAPLGARGHQYSIMRPGDMSWTDATPRRALTS